jgi:hypothetical protein
VPSGGSPGISLEGAALDSVIDDAVSSEVAEAAVLPHAVNVISKNAADRIIAIDFFMFLFLLRFVWREYTMLTLKET